MEPAPNTGVNISLLDLDMNASWGLNNMTFYNQQNSLAMDLEILQKIVPILVPILFSIIIITGFIGNLLVVGVVALNKNMMNTTNLLILNLAISDILFIVFCVPSTAVDYALTSAWPFGDVWCRLSQFLIPATAFVSIYTLVLMALDRFLAVVFPVASITVRTIGYCRLAILLAWVLSLGLSSPAIFLHGILPDPTPEDEHQVVCRFSGGEPAYVAFQASFFVLSYSLPLALIVALYSVMLHTLWNKTGGAGVSKDALRNKRRVVKLVTIVTVMFALSWLPIQLILLLKSLKLYNVTLFNIAVQIGSHVLAYSNSCINPFLYAFLSPPFKTGFLNLIPCLRTSSGRPRSEETIILTKISTNTVETRVIAITTPSSAARQPSEK